MFFSSLCLFSHSHFLKLLLLSLLSRIEFIAQQGDYSFSIWIMDIRSLQIGSFNRLTIKFSPTLNPTPPPHEFLSDLFSSFSYANSQFLTLKPYEESKVFVLSNPQLLTDILYKEYKEVSFLSFSLLLPASFLIHLPHRLQEVLPVHFKLRDMMSTSSL